jgi:subtilisin family serine protease
MAARGLGVLVVVAGLGLAFAGPLPVDSEVGSKAGAAVVAALADQGLVRVVVTLRRPASAGDGEWNPEDIAAAQREVLAGLEADDFRLGRQWRNVPGFSGWVSLSGLARLERHPLVDRIDVDGVVKKSLAESVPLIHGDEARSMGFTGADVIVAVLDSGADAGHPYIGVSLAAERCFCDGCCPGGGSEESGDGAAADGDGHGTHVSGTIVAPGIDQPVGVAPGAYLAAVKVLDDEGSGFSSDIVAGLDWVLSEPVIKVVNMSLGGGRYSTVCDDATASTRAYADAIAALRARGTLTVVASGNDGYTDAVSSPACTNASLAVGAVYDSNFGSRSCDSSTAPDKVACFSNSSTLVELLAPGSTITAAAVGGGTDTLSGTSMATPHVAGAAAVLYGVRPSITPSQIIDILKRTGRPVTDKRNNVTISRIDLAAAVRAAR